jgi:hypothetical protein
MARCLVHCCLLHAVKFRPEFSTALGKLGACLTFPTEGLYECLMYVLVYLGRTCVRSGQPTPLMFVPDAVCLKVYCDSDWGITRSTTGYCVMLAGAAVVNQVCPSALHLDVVVRG